MVGDDFAQKLFYKVCAFIWAASGVQKGKDIQAYQDALIEDVFGWRHKMDFIKKEKEPTEVSTWDGKYIGYVNHFHLEKMAAQIGILGPIGGLYGCDIEQEIMSLKSPIISMMKFNHSVTIAKYALKASIMTDETGEYDTLKESSIN